MVDDNVQSVYGEDDEDGMMHHQEELLEPQEEEEEICDAEFFDDPNLEILFVNEDDTYPIIVVYDHRKHTHHIYNAHIETATYNQHSDLDYYGEGYDEDEGSDRLDSEVFFRPIQFSPEEQASLVDIGLNGPKADAIVMCDGFEGQALLVLLKKKEKKAYVYKLNPTIGNEHMMNDCEDNLQINEMTNSFSVTLWEMSFLCVHENITAAAKIDSEGIIFNDHESNHLSARESLLMLLLSETKKLVIVYAGEHRLCELSLPDTQANVIDVTDVVHNRLTVVMSDRTRHRFLVGVTCESDITSRSFAVMRRTLPPALFSSLFYDFWNYKQLYVMKYDTEWEMFSNFLTCLILQSNGVQGTMQNETVIDNWSLLMNSAPDQFPGDTLFDTIPVSNAARNRNVSCEFATDLDEFSQYLPLLILTLHLLYETTKINSLDNSQYLKQMATELYRLCRMIGRENYCDLYVRDFPSLSQLAMSETVSIATNIEGIVAIQAMETIEFFDFTFDHNIVVLYLKGEIVPNIYRTLFELLSPPNPNYPVIPHPIIKNCPLTQWTRRICRLFDLLNYTNDIYAGGYASNIGKLTNPFERLIIAMVDEGINSVDDLNDLPFGIALPMIQSIHHCRSNYSFSAMSPATFEKVNRLLGREDLLQLLQSHLGSREDYHHLFANSSSASDEIYFDFDGTVTDVTASVSPSSKSVALEQQVQMSKKGIGYFVFHQDNRLLEVYRMLDSSTPMTVKKEILNLSDDDLDRFDPSAFENQHLFVKLRQRVLSLPVGRGMITLATKNTQQTDSIKIPVIASTGLLKRNRTNVVLDLLPADQSESFKWAEFHNGVATGLSFQRIDGNDPASNGVTREWIIYHRPRKLTSAHAGMLLALGIQGHLSVLSPTDIFSYMYPRHEMTTIALLLGLSASKRGSQDSPVSKALTLHIPSLVSTSRVEMPAEVQCAALVGTGLLYCQSSHRLMTDVLLTELTLSPRDSTSNCVEGYALAAGFGLGLICLAQGTKSSAPPGLTDLNINERLIRYMTGGTHPESNFVNKVSKGSMFANRSNFSSNKMQESGRYVNVDVAGPGACVALSLIYLRSHNELIANELMIPTTRYQLDYIRPQMALLRTVGFNIVMWDTIRNTPEWLVGQIPSIISDSVFPNIQNMVEIDDHLASLYAFIVTGCCITLGLRYAGSHDQRAYDIIFGIMKEFESGKLKKMTKTDNVITLPLVLNKQVTENCLVACAMALGCVMSGSGDIEAVRVLRRLRKRFTTQPSNVSASVTSRDEATYGLQLGLSMALGLLFLGGGRCSFSTKPTATAFLLIALYPHLPLSPTDNQYHLQAFRHLYALAAEPRLIEARFVDDNQLCFSPVTINMIDGSSQQKRLPCLAPELQTIESISIVDEQCYPLTLNLNSRAGGLQKSSTSNNLLLYVKKKTLSVRSRTDNTPPSQMSQLKYSNNNNSNSSDNFDGTTVIGTLSNIFAKGVSESQADHFNSMMLDSTHLDSISIIYLRQSIEFAIRQLSNPLCHATTPNTVNIGNLKLVLAFYEHIQQGSLDSTRLLLPDYCHQIRTAVINCLQDVTNTIATYLRGAKPGSALTGCVLEWCNIPSLHTLNQIALDLKKLNQPVTMSLWCDLLGPSLHFEAAQVIHSFTNTTTELRNK